MSHLTWLPQALDDVVRLHAFLHTKNPDAAARAALLILEGAKTLKTAPEIGRPMNDGTGRREWFIAYGAGAYVLRYMLEGKNTAVIVRVWHSREDRGTV